MGLGIPEHHWAGWIDAGIAGTKSASVPLATKRHRIIVARVALDGTLHPHHAARASISFQRRNSCRVRRDEISQGTCHPSYRITTL